MRSKGLFLKNLALALVFVLLCFSQSPAAQIFEGPDGQIYIGDYLPRALAEKGYEPRRSLGEAGSFYPRNPDHKDFLWKVTSKTDTVYVLGSVHVGERGLYPLSKTIEDAFSGSGELAVEANIDSGNLLRNSSQIKKALLESALYPAGDSLKKHISSRTYALVGNRVDELGWNMAAADRCRPWFLDELIEMSDVGDRGFSGDYGIDKHFLIKAESAGKKILELEGLDYQIRMFRNYSDRQQEDFLLFSIKGPGAGEAGNGEDGLKAVLTIWASGDARKLARMIDGDIRQHPDLRPVFEKFLFERNRNMAAKIEKYLEANERVFVVVGAAHVVGERGIISLLEKKGYKARQMEFQPPAPVSD